MLETIFLELLNISITAGYLILAVILLRFLLKRSPRWINCLLWAIVGLRLVFPFSIESALSLIPSAETVPTDILYAETPAIQSGIPAVNAAVNPILSEAMTPEVGASVNPMQVMTLAASVVWLIGMCGLLVYSLISYLLLRRRVIGAVRLRADLWQSEQVASPFILGVVRPRIYLPFDMDGQTLQSVEAHERAHLKRRDHWIKPLAFLLLCVYWFNPLMWVAYILLCRDIELACDERVIRQLGEDARRDYAAALLACGVGRRRIAACPLAFGEVGIKARIKSVMNYRKPAFWIVLAAVIACIAVTVCFLTVPQKQDDLPSFGGIRVTELGSDMSGVSVTPTILKPGMTMRVEWKNNTLQTLTRGYAFTLYYRVSGKWVPVSTKEDIEVAFNSLGITVPVFGTDHQSHDLEVYKMSMAGAYRYETTFSAGGETYSAWFEFTVPGAAELSGEYRMIAPKENAAEYLLIPRLYINEKTAEFSIVHDYASSYLILGNYTLEDDLFVGTTSDGLYTYRFHRRSDGAFVFLQDGSDELQPHDERVAPGVYNGAVFERVAEEAPIAYTDTTADCTADGECEVHRMEFHNVDGQLLAVIPQAEFDTFTETYKRWSIVDIVREFDISKEDFMKAMDITAENLDEPLYDSSDDWLTNREYVEAIYTNDAEAMAAAFRRPPIESQSERYELVVSMQEGKNTQFTPKGADYTVHYTDVREVAVYNGDAWVDLKTALLDGSVTMERILQKAEADMQAGVVPYLEYKDGGSRMYVYPSYAILKMNTIDGDRRVFIGGPNMSRPTVETTQSTVQSTMTTVVPY